MKTITVPAFAAAVLTVSAASGQNQRFQQEAVLIDSPTEFKTVWITDATKTQMKLYETERGVDSVTMRISKPASIWLIEPTAYTEAIELYQGRNYEAARSKFAEVRETYKRLQELPNNHSSLSALYEMECLRKLGKLEEIKKVEETFLPVERASLSRPHHVRQIEIYTLWEAVRNKDWGRLELLCNGQLQKKMPGYQRAQVGYCLGLALEGQKRPIEAINAYNIGMTADTGASEVLTAKSAINALRLYTEDESVKQAIALHGTPDEDDLSSGFLRLQEAASLAALYELTLGNGKELPGDYKELLKYLPKDS